MADSSNPPSSPGERPSSPPFSEGYHYEDETENLRQEGTEDVVEEEEEGEELFGDDMARDYRSIPQLDTYDPNMLDESEQQEISLGARARIERQLAKRDAEEAMRVRGKTRLPAGLGFGDDEEEDTGELPRRRRRIAERSARPADSDAQIDEGDEQEYAEDETIIENLEDRKGHTLREWITMGPTQREIYNRFKNFLRTATDNSGKSIYGKRIRDMCEANGESLVVSYIDLCNYLPAIAIFVADAPTETLEIFDAAAKDVVLEHFPNYHRIKSDIHVRVGALPVLDAIRDIRQTHLNALVKLQGVVTRRTGVFPQLKLVKYTCEKCNSSIGPVAQDTITETAVANCPTCQSRGPFSINTEETVYRNYQRITIQESPGSVPPGRLPRQKDIVLLWDYVDFVKPGDEIEVTGIYRNNFDKSLNSKHGFPVFSTVIEANYIEKKADKLSQDELSDDDIKAIRRLAEDENVGTKLIRSVAPSIYGHEDIKTAIALAMFGGEPKNPGGKHRVRGDINLLLLGDPGTAKSQFLKYVEKTAHRAVFTTGQGASAVGLTASVSRDPVTREWTLQGGALVLADQGACLIDEFDKMSDQDRTSIHEAMEQQSISVSKAGIVTTLQARCSVMAAANPIRGRYQPGKTFAQNVDLTEPILSRFDILCVVKDVVDAVKDERLAAFVVNSHMKSHPIQDDMDETLDGMPGNEEPPISQELLRKYIQYAKRNVHPKLQQMDQDKIAKLYGELRRESQLTGSVPITVRHIESMIRIAEAHARMHLRDYVRQDDVDMAIRVTLTSFIESQKFSVMKNMRRKFQKYITYKRDNNELLMFLLLNLHQETLSYHQTRYNQDIPDIIEIDLDEFAARARQLDIHDLTEFLKSDELSRNGFSVQGSKIKKTYE